MSPEFVKVLEETGTGETAVEDVDDDVYIEDSYQVFLKKQEDLMAYITAVEAKAATPTLKAQLGGL